MKRIFLITALICSHFSSIAQNGRFNSLEEASENPSQVVELTLYNKSYPQFPMEILKMTNLQKLSILFCKLENLPDEIGQLTKLEELVIGNNNISEILRRLEISLT